MDRQASLLPGQPSISFSSSSEVPRLEPAAESPEGCENPEYRICISHKSLGDADAIGQELHLQHHCLKAGQSSDFAFRSGRLESMPVCPGEDLMV